MARLVVKFYYFFFNFQEESNGDYVLLSSFSFKNAPFFSTIKLDKKSAHAVTNKEFPAKIQDGL